MFSWRMKQGLRHLQVPVRTIVASWRLSHERCLIATSNFIGLRQARQIRAASSYNGKYFFIDQELRNTPSTQFKDIQAAEESDTFSNGDIVEAWDHVFRWTQHCVPLHTWHEWRQMGDDLADAALPVIAGPAGSGGGTDMLARLEVAAKTTHPDPVVTRFWDALHAKGSPRHSDLWPDEAQILRGQAVYWRYAPQMASALLHYSLAAGFSSPRIARILNLASYLVPPMSSSAPGEPPKMSKASVDRSFMRLMETTQWLMHCMTPGGLTVGTGVGWRSTVRVRLLHTTMRKRIVDRSRQLKAEHGSAPYDEEVDGVPISQEDFMATQCAFACAPLFCLSKQGITPSQQECEDWTALWRVIGYYFGIQPDLLTRHFSNWEKSKAIGSSTIAAMFAGESDPPPPVSFPFDRNAFKQHHLIEPKTPPVNHKRNPYTTPATLPVLFCISKRWPIYFSFPQHCAAARHLTGETLSDWLSIPRTSWYYGARYRFGTFLSSLPPRFARLYRSAWDAKRNEIMRKSLDGAIKFELGNRTTKFRPRKPGAFQPEKEGDEFHGVDQGSAVGGLFGEWARLYGEVAVVFAFVAGLVALPGVGYWNWRSNDKRSDS